MLFSSFAMQAGLRQKESDSRAQVRRDGLSYVINPRRGEQVEVLFAYGVSSAHATGKIFIDRPATPSVTRSGVGTLSVRNLPGGEQEYTFTPEAKYDGHLQLRVGGKEVALPGYPSGSLGASIEMGRTPGKSAAAKLPLEINYQEFEISEKQRGLYTRGARFDVPSNGQVRMWLRSEDGRQTYLGQLGGDIRHEHVDSKVAALFRRAEGDRDRYSVGLRPGFSGTIIIETPQRIFQINPPSPPMPVAEPTAGEPAVQKK